MSKSTWLVAIMSLLVQGCTPPTSGGILVDAPTIRNEGETCASGQLICLRQEATPSSGCPTKKGSSRTVTVTSIKDGARIAVRFDLKITPDEPTGLQSSLIRTFSAKQSTASLGCDILEDNINKGRFVQLIYVCARELANGETEPDLANMKCKTPAAVFDPNTLPSKPLAVSESNQMVVNMALTEPDMPRVRVASAFNSSDCRSLCENSYAGECLRLRLETSLYDSIVAPALPSAAALPGVFEKERYMKSLGVSEDPCERGNLNFKDARFNNTGQGCVAKWTSPGIGAVSIALPAKILAGVQTEGGQSRLVFKKGNEVRIHFSDSDFQDLNGPISQLDVSSVATYARLPSICLSLKPSASTVAVYSSMAHAVLQARTSLLSRGP